MPAECKERDKGSVSLLFLSCVGVLAFRVWIPVMLWSRFGEELNKESWSEEESTWDVDLATELEERSKRAEPGTYDSGISSRTGCQEVRSCNCGDFLF